MREYIKIKSKDGKAEKTIEKSEYTLYAQSGWQEVKKDKDYSTDTSKPTYSSTAYSYEKK